MAEVPGVVDSARFIAGRAVKVAISEGGVVRTAEALHRAMCTPDGTWSAESSKLDTLEPAGLSEEEALEWWFLVDTLNFCFWSDEAVLFTVSHRGREWTGYRSLCAALAKAHQRGLPIHKPNFYSKITRRQLEKIFSSETHVQIPLFEKRIEILHETASILQEKFGGSVSTLVCGCNKSAQTLVRTLATHFPSYRDISTYNGQFVSFLKRAQIFTADVWNRFSGRGFGEFYDINSLTMFADYRVPQSLQFMGVLEYEEGLFQRLCRGEHLEPGCVEENEIRGCSIWAVELLKEEIARLSREGQSSPTTAPAAAVNSTMIDFYLWNYAKLNSSKVAGFPIHRTLTIYY